MLKKAAVNGLLVTLAALGVGLAILWLAAKLIHEPNMRLFCFIWFFGLPPGCGFYAGWQDARGGFGVGACSLLAPMLICAALWWWLLPELWDGLLCLKAGFYALFAAGLGGGAGAGLKKARDKFYPPPVGEEEGE